MQRLKECLHATGLSIQEEEWVAVDFVMVMLKPFFLSTQGIQSDRSTVMDAVMMWENLTLVLQKMAREAANGDHKRILKKAADIVMGRAEQHLTRNEDFNLISFLHNPGMVKRQEIMECITKVHNATKFYNAELHL
jgi:hypothetical protein